MPPEQRLTSRAVLSHRWLRASGATAPPSMNPGLAGAVVDPACRQLVRLVAAEFGYSQREVLEALRRGERSTATATYFLVRQRELRKGAIKNYRAMLPRPPPPRLPTARRRPIPAHLARAAAKLPPPTLPQLTLPMAGLRIDLAQERERAHAKQGHGGAAHGAAKPREHARDDSHGQTALGGAAHVQGRGVPAPVVHESGALTERVDRDGAVRRAREMSLPTPGREEPTSRRGHGGAMPPMAAGKVRVGVRVGVRLAMPPMAAGKARTAVLSLSPSPSPNPNLNPSLSPMPSPSLSPSLPLPPPLSRPLQAYPDKVGNCARVSEIRPLHGSDRSGVQQGAVNAAALGISGRRAARFPMSSPRGKV